MSFQQLSGINVVLFYSQSIFEKAGSSLDPSIATILVGIVQVLASGCTPLIVDRLGRKIILLVSAAGMAVCLGLLGLFFLLDHQKADIVSSITWLPIASLVGFVIVYCVGFGPLPWAVFGNLKFPIFTNFPNQIFFFHRRNVPPKHQIRCQLHRHFNLLGVGIRCHQMVRVARSGHRQLWSLLVVRRILLCRILLRFVHINGNERTQLAANSG